MMEKSNEKQRALNIIWNASKNYGLKALLTAYDECGKADLYWNYIIGSVYKYFDYNLLREFFDNLKYDRDCILYQQIMMLGLEGCIYEKEKKDRPALAGLRCNCGEKALKTQDSGDVFDEIAAAYFSRIRGNRIRVRDSINSLLDDLYFDKLDTDHIIQKMDYIIKKYFEPEYKDEFYIKKLRPKKFLNLIKRNSMKKTNDEGTWTWAEDEEDKDSRGRGKIISKLYKIKENLDKKDRDFIVNYFGTSLYEESKNTALERILCDGNHNHCHLHFTRGLFQDNKDTLLRRKLINIQKQKNIENYAKNFIRNANNINKLTARIKNAITNDSYAVKTERGKLISSRAWRTVLEDTEIFIKNIEEDLADFSVDLMLDASASQLYRQEVIAEEAYIIAESLTRLKIPLKIYSFCNMRDYTVINLFREYNEINGNDRIFNYYAAGFNRDGMAIRTAIHMMEGTKYRHKILIILSDGKPNDMLGVHSQGRLPFMKEYSDETGLDDTANEVRKGWQKGLSILCVFTGRDEDIPSVKKIYGNKFTRIETLDKFAEMVGLLLEKELMNKE